MVDIPPDEKVIFKQGLLGKAIITDKAVYKKGIISSLERYDFNDIICMFCEKEYKKRTHYDSDHGTIEHITVEKRIKMVLSNGKVVEFLSYPEGGHSGATSDVLFLMAGTLGLGKTTERVISEAIKKNLPPGKLLFYEYPPIPIGKIDEMIKEHRSPEEIRREVQRMAEERIESIKKVDRSPMGKAINIALSLFNAGAMALIFAFLLIFLIVETGLARLDFDTGERIFILLWLILTALLTFPVYSRMKKLPEHPL
jgi:hypothetical protein